MTLPPNSHLEELLKAYKNGNLKAFEEFFVTSKDPLYSFVKRRIGNSEVSQDIIQEAYFRIHRYISSFNVAKGAAVPWVLSIVQNCIYDYWAQQKSQPFAELDPGSAQSITSTTAEDEFFFKELILQLEKKITQEELELLLDRLVGEFSFDEIASQRGIRADNARQKFLRIMNKIRK